MPSPACPTRVDLSAYIVGKLSAQRSEEIDMHLPTCSDCQQTLETIDVLKSDTVLSQIGRRRARGKYLDEPECAEALARVQAIGREPSLATQRQLAKSAMEQPFPERIGPYRLLAKLGEGGMGAVYKALHTKLDRVVALKLLPGDRLRDPDAVARFEREVRAVGKLDHPNIVRASDADEEDGMHYLVMEYVEGIDLSELVRRSGPLPTGAACELIRQAAVGLEHAYEHGLVHRDIKPSNLMLAPDGTVKILDLGLALLDEAVGEDAPELTSTGQTMGTLDYMAPEQGGDSHDVDIRADIYALGATLYKLLTGEPIYAGGKYSTPVQKLTALALTPAPPIQERRADIPDELATVIQKMIAKDPDERFATPAEVANAFAPFAEQASASRLLDAVDIDAASAAPAAKPSATSTTSLLKESRDQQTAATLQAEPLVEPRRATGSLPTSADARPHTRPWLQRPAARLAIAAGLAGILIAAAIFYLQTPHGTLRVEIDDPAIEVTVKGEDIVLTNADKEPISVRAGEHALIVTRGDDFTFETKQLILRKGETTTVKVELLPGRVQVVSAGHVFGEHALGQTPPGAENTALEFDGETSYVAIPSIKDLPQEAYTIEAYLESPETSADRTVFEIQGTASLSRSRDLRQHANYVYAGGKKRMSLRGATYTPNHMQHVAAVWHKDEFQLFIDGERKGYSQTFDRQDVTVGTCIIGAAWSQTGFFRGVVDELRISSVARYDKDFTPPKVGDRFTPDEHTVALYHFDDGQGDVLRDSSGNNHHGKIVGAKWVRVDGPSGSSVSPSIPAGAITAEPFKFMPGDPMSNSTAVQRPPKIAGLSSWTIETVQPRDSTTGALAYSPDGKWLAGAGRDHAVRIWDTASGDVKRMLLGHAKSVECVAWSPDGAYVATAAGYDSVRLWEASTGRALRVIRAADMVGAIAWSPDGRSLAFDSDRERKVYLYDVRAGKTTKTLPAGGWIYSLAWSPDGRLLAVGGDRTDEITVWDVETGEKIRSLIAGNPYGGIRGMEFSPSGDRVAAKGYGDAAMIWNVETGEKIREGLSGYGNAVAWSNDGNLLYAGATRWNLATGAQTIVRGKNQHVIWFAWSRDRTRIASAHDWGYVEQTNIETGERVKFATKWNRVEQVAWSPDGTKLLVGTPVHGQGYLWDATALKRLASTGEYIEDAAWSPDGRGFALVARGRVELWKAQPLEKVLTIPGIDDPDSLAWSPNGARLAMGMHDGKVLVWDRQSQKVLHTLEAHATSVTDVSWSADGSLLATCGDKDFIKVWETATWKPRRNLASQYQQHAAAWSPLGNQLAFSEGGFQVWDAKTDTIDHLEVGDWIPDTGGVARWRPRPKNHVIAYSPDGSALASGTESGGPVWCDVATRKYTYINAGHVGKTEQALSFAPDGTYLATAGDDTAWIWDWKKKQASAVLRHLPDEQWLVITADGHWQGGEKAHEQVRYVALTDTGEQLTFTPAEFATKYGWRNDPSKVRLLPDK